MPVRHGAISATALLLAFALGCSSPPRRPSVPALTPQEAAELLHYNSQAQGWLTYVRRQNPSCTYNLELPDQRAHPTEIDLNHTVFCSGRPAPTEFDAAVSFVYDPNQHAWVIKRFSS